MIHHSHVPSDAGPLVVEGVDVTGYPIFNSPKVYYLHSQNHLYIISCCCINKRNLWNQVQKAICFASKAHHGQLRKNGEPYLAHCLHTGRTLAILVPSSGERVCIWFLVCSLWRLGALEYLSLSSICIVFNCISKAECVSQIQSISFVKWTSCYVSSKSMQCYAGWIWHLLSPGKLELRIHTLISMVKRLII